MLHAEPAGEQQLSVKTGARRGTHPSKAGRKTEKKTTSSVQSLTHQELLKACQLAAIPFVLTSTDIDTRKNSSASLLLPERMISVGPGSSVVYHDGNVLPNISAAKRNLPNSRSVVAVAVLSTAIAIAVIIVASLRRTEPVSVLQGLRQQSGSRVYGIRPRMQFSRYAFCSPSFCFAFTVR
jgi:hypothetical protein